MEDANTLHINSDTRNFAGLPIEVRYPLDLTPVVQSLREYFISVNRSLPSAIKELDLSSSDFGDYSPDQRDAAALVWSARSWVEYNGVSESQALLVRICLERDREVDLKYALAARAAERALYADYCRQMAESLSRYYRNTNSTTLNQLYKTSTIRNILDINQHPDGSLAGYLLAIAEFDRDWWSTCFETTSIESVKKVVSRCLNSKDVQLAAFWTYFEHREKSFSNSCRETIAQSIERAMSSRNLAVAIPALGVKSGTEPLCEAGLTIVDSGLGDASYEMQVTAALRTFHEMQSRFEALGIGVRQPQWLTTLSQSQP